MHKETDQIRDATPKRKEMHKQFDKIRNKRPARKSQLSDYELTATRRHYRKKRDNLRYQNKLLSTLATDTGFDVICSSCLQYKSKQYCKLISFLDQKKRKKFIFKYCSGLQNRYNGQFVCNLCLKDIKKNKMPNRSHKNSFKFANFPDYFIEDVKKKFNFKENGSKSKLLVEDFNYERRAM